MATDAKELDTDDHRRPSKRQCTRLLKGNESYWDTENLSSDEEEMIEDEDIVYDNVERHAREELKRWQASQMNQGSMDNAVNKLVEKYITGMLTAYRLRSRESDMEDRGVMMAIRNHGLKQSARLMSHSCASNSYEATEYCVPNRVQGFGNFPGTGKPVHPANFLRLCNMEQFFRLAMGMDRYHDLNMYQGLNIGDIAMEMERYNGLDLDVDRVDDSEDFLERAVAEAIKKKGLSMRSVQYD